jgi:pyruvate/2-oxoglutarate dehydrogenase complex dihydrolipoamide acyltransferase (E2) component
MSALWAPIAAWGDGVRTTGRPLRAVAQPAARLARFPFLLVLIGVFGLGMVGLLMLNTTLQSQAFQSRTLNRQAGELAYAQADLENQLDALAAPQELARRASELGMRPNPFPAFLVLPSGKVVGKPIPVGGHEVPALIVKTPTQLAAEQAAKRARAEAKAAAKAAKEDAAAAEAKRKAAERAAKQKAAERAAAKHKKATSPAGTTTKKGTHGRGQP